MKTVKAIFISHEHSDHIAGLQVLSKKYSLPVYITEATHKKSGLKIESRLIFSFSENEKVSIGELTVTPFRKSHDADDPHSFLVSGNEINIGVITDIGHACRRVIKHFKQCDAVFLESNYCDQMLADGSYPVYLKKRISGNDGHLSNDQALDLFLKHRSTNLKLLILSHLSQNNNHPDIVNEMFQPHSNTVKIVVASRHKESDLFCVEKSLNIISSKNFKKLKQNRMQLSLFE